jgi:predicted DNA-binding protein
MSRPVRDEVQSAVVRVRLSPRELERLKEAAKVNGQTSSAFMREAIEGATSDCLEPMDPWDEKDGIASP